MTPEGGSSVDCENEEKELFREVWEKLKTRGVTKSSEVDFDQQEWTQHRGTGDAEGRGNHTERGGNDQKVPMTGDRSSIMAETGRASGRTKERPHESTQINYTWTTCSFMHNTRMFLAKKRDTWHDRKK